MTITTTGNAQIFQHITPEDLKRQNAEFLAKYPTDDAQIDYYTDLAMKLWDEFQIDGAYEVRGTRVNIATWYESKRKQMELFRKHPYWCEEAKAIIFAYNEERGVSFNVASREIHGLRVYIHKHTNSWPNGDHVLCALEKTFELLIGNEPHEKHVMTDKFIEFLNHYLVDTSGKPPKSAQRMMSVGTKISRFIRKCCEEFQLNSGDVIDVTKFEDAHESGDRSFDSFEKHFAKLADALSEISTKKMALASINFLDFMTMSNGNSWSTCHYINSHGLFHSDDGNGSSYHGAYKQGCLSYALDEPSFIFYTLPIDFKENDYYRCKKMTRMCCQYANGVMITGKCYPNNETSLINKYRDMLQNVVSAVETSANEWEVSDSTETICELVSTAARSAHYADYTISRQRPTISLCRKIMHGTGKQMTIGHKAYCLHCGKEMDGCSEWLQCSSHRRRMVCKQCGKKIEDGMEYREIGEHLYCSDCIFYCAVHGRYESASNPHQTILMKDGEVQVCEDAMTRLEKCVCCGVYGLKSHMLHTTEGYACKKHVRRYKKCSMCGTYELNKQIHVDDNGNVFCAKCKDFLDGIGQSPFVTFVKDSYEVGDYIVVADDVSYEPNGANEIMENYYPGRIVRVVRAGNEYNYGFSGLGKGFRDDDGRWHWSKSSIKCAILGVDDSFIGKKFAEIAHLTRGE